MADNSVPYSTLAIITAILTLSIIIPSIFVHNDHLFIAKDTPTKLEFGVNITIKPITRIYENRSEHFYLMKLPTGGKHYDLTNDRISSTTEIYSVDAFPLYNPETVELLVGEVTNGTEDNSTTFNVTRDYFKFDIGSRTTTIDSDDTRFWALRLITPQFADGYFNITLRDGESIEIDPDIDACGTLSDPNTVYTLTDDISDTGATCLTVGAQNITIDCAGFSITGDNTASTRGVYSDEFNTTVKNCVIEDFATGVYIDGDSADYANITNNTITLTYSSCSGTTGSCNGVFIKSADNCTINENTISTYRHSINLYSSANNNTIQYNDIAVSNAYGIYFHTSCDNNVIQYNNITSLSTNGIYFTTNCDNNTIRYNYVDVLYRALYLISTISYNTIQYNNFTASGNTGMYLLGHYNTIEYNNITTDDTGFKITNSNSNTIKYNNIIALDDYSIDIYASNDNTISHNNLSANDKTIKFGTFNTCNNNLFDNNSIIATATYPIYFDDSGSDFNNFTNNTIYGSGTTAIMWEDADDATGNRFVQNNITADVWVDDKEGGNFYNDSEGVGNIYYFSNGTPSWDVYDITCSGGAPCWADGGDDVPLNASLTEWIGFGNDSHPYIAPPQPVFDNQPYIWDGNSWISYIGENLQFRCSIDGIWPTWCSPTNQDNLSGQPIFRIQNNATTTSSWQAIRTNATWGTTATLYCGNDTDPLIESVNVTTVMTNYSTEDLSVGSNRSLFCALRISSIPANFQRTFNVSFENG